MLHGVDVIRKKRDGLALSDQEILFFVDKYMQGEIPDYQASAFLMAVLLRGMSFEETLSLTKALRDSGDVLKYGFRYVCGKHSTGGVGDKLSFICAPIVASLGIKVPMLSGRALGITGGTLDKLSSLSGYNLNLQGKSFQTMLDKCSVAFAGQGKNVTPADGRFYALRDATATVESRPLIVSSIVSKKLAEGSPHVVFDVKYGSGSFMKRKDDALSLAHDLVRTFTALGGTAAALLSDMNVPLGYSVGNFFEVREALEFLSGDREESDVLEVSLALASEMIFQSGYAMSREEALELAEKQLKNKQAYKAFCDNIEQQGSSLSEVERNWDRRAPVELSWKAQADGYIHNIDAGIVGHAGIALQVGREKASDDVELFTGVLFSKKVGDKIRSGEEIAKVYAATEERGSAALAELEQALTIENKAFTRGPLVQEIIEA